ncbi:MAG: 2-amino-4-hydroxy-6-hydroxymethyldihydropteridine diphosphokinase [Woeseiaceae bacterium]
MSQSENERGEPVRAFIGIGSNLDDPRSQVEAAFSLLDTLPGCHVVAKSSLYRSAPFGDVQQDDFVNAVVAVETAVPPAILLSCLKELERSQGRDFNAERWGPRVLDLDILLYGDEVMDTPELQIPHPGIVERIFVLLPLREIADELVIPGLGPVVDIVVDDKSPLISKMD